MGATQNLSLPEKLPEKGRGKTSDTCEIAETNKPQIKGGKFTSACGATAAASGGFSSGTATAGGGGASGTSAGKTTTGAGGCSSAILE